MFKLLLIGLGFLAMVAMLAMDVWRAFTYSPDTRSYAPFVLGLAIIVVLMALALLARGRRR
jgi:hypothetical protein